MAGLTIDQLGATSGLSIGDLIPVLKLGQTTAQAVSFQVLRASDQFLPMASSIGGGDIIPIIQNGSQRVATATLLGSGLAQNVSTFYGAMNSAVGRTTISVLRERIRLTDVSGVAGDFDGVGNGTDSRAGIQNVLSYAATKPKGAVIIAGDGSFYLGTGYFDASSGMNAQLLLGSRTSANAAVNIDIVGEGASIYIGNVGRGLVLANCKNVSIRGINWFGYAGGALGASRESDNAIYIGWSSQKIRILDSYITNVLGWLIGGGGDTTQAGGGTGNTVMDILIANCILKGRYGDGIVASDGGSLTQQCIQFIDVDGVKISDVTHYGRIKFEPNLNGQYMANIDVGDCTGRSGYVTAVVPTSNANYWTDEALGLYDSGGSVLQQAISLDGIPGAPKVYNVRFHDCTMEFGQVIANKGPYQANISNIDFKKGRVLVGTGGGGNVNRFFRVNDCSAEQTIDGLGGFIMESGLISYGVFNHNVLINENLPCVSNNGPSTGDNGTSFYVLNASPLYSGDPVSIGTRQSTTTVLSSFNGMNSMSGTTNIGTLIAAGNATVAGSVNVPEPNGTALFALDVSGGSSSAGTQIANNGTSTILGNANNFSGVLIVNDTTNFGEVAMFFSGGAATKLIAQSGTKFSSTAANPGTVNVYISGNAVTVENKVGSAVTISAMALRTRASQ